jgi:tetratricopeptide (TPR) repeat protein
MVTEYIKNINILRLTIQSGNSVELKDVELKPEEILPPYTSQVLAFKAIILRTKGEPNEFEKQALKAYEFNSKDKLSLIAMVLVNVDKGRYSETIKNLEQAGKDEHDSLILLTRPLVFGKAKEIDKARKFYREIPEELLKTKNVLYRGFLNEIEENVKITLKIKKRVKLVLKL